MFAGVQQFCSSSSGAAEGGTVLALTGMQSFQVGARDMISEWCWGRMECKIVYAASSLCACYAVPGTDFVYAAMRCPVLKERMVLPG
eukprot:1544491-Rhodomonas_salina.1